MKFLKKLGLTLQQLLTTVQIAGNVPKACPSGAFRITDGVNIRIRTDLCEGANCRRCMHACPESGFKWEDLVVEGVE